jgi:hypothetical protein
MLRVEVVVDVFVKFLIGPCRFGGVEIASAGDITVGCVEVECTRHRFEVLYW